MKNGGLTQIESNSAIYHVNGLDAGHFVKAIFKAKEEKDGSGEVIFGPIRIDASIKKTLENILGVGGSKFPIVILNKQEGCEKKVWG